MSAGQSITIGRAYLLEQVLVVVEHCYLMALQRGLHEPVVIAADLSDDLGRWLSGMAAGTAKVSSTVNGSTNGFRALCFALPRVEAITFFERLSLPVPFHSSPLVSTFKAVIVADEGISTLQLDRPY